MRGGVRRGKGQGLGGLLWLEEEKERGYVCRWRAGCRVERGCRKVSWAGTEVHSAPLATNCTTGAISWLAPGTELHLLLVGSSQTMKKSSWWMGAGYLSQGTKK